MIILENFINGERIAPLEGQYLDNYNPTTGEVFSQLPDSSEADLEMTVDAAQRAFPSWSLLSRI